MRAAQSFGIALLFVPISTISYVTLPKELNGDAAALYTMFRNVSGSIGISLSTADGDGAHADPHAPTWWTRLSTFDQGYNGDDRAHTSRPCSAMGHAAETTMTTATGQVYQMLRTQASGSGLLGRVRMFCAVAAFCVVPFAFLFSNVKVKGGGGGH